MWDTVEFKLFVPEDKIKRTKEKVEELLEKEGEKIPIKKIASFCGLMTSLRPALGDIARFRTRFLLQIVDEAQKAGGWGAKAELDEGARDELKFWRKGLEEYNGFIIRPRPGVVAVKQIKMVSNTGEHMAGGGERPRLQKLALEMAELCQEHGISKE